jgi:Signal transduction histidine kinase
MQEALQNVHKHAQARRSGSCGRSSKDQWVMHCTDDGSASTREGRAPSAVGRMLAMRERAELIGARLQVQSTPGQGTAVTLLLPTSKEGDTLGR